MPKLPPAIQIQTIRDQIIVAKELSVEIKVTQAALDVILSDLSNRINELIESVLN